MTASNAWTPNWPRTRGRNAPVRPQYAPDRTKPPGVRRLNLAAF